MYLTLKEISNIQNRHNIFGKKVFSKYGNRIDGINIEFILWILCSGILWCLFNK